MVVYIQARLEAGLNIIDREVLQSYYRDYLIIKKGLQTNKKLFDLELRVDNLASTIRKLETIIEDKRDFR